MGSYYLVDYENVASGGFEGADALTIDDEVIIFYTNNAKKIDLDIIMMCDKTKVTAIRVPAGKQSTDMHIGTYLGLLIGANGGVSKEYIVLSNDTDYDGIIQFWINKNIKVYRRYCIKNDENRKEKIKTGIAKNVNTDLYCEIQQALSRVGYLGDDINYIASLSVKNHDIKNGKQQTYRSIIAKYGQAKGLKIYTAIKKMI